MNGNFGNPFAGNAALAQALRSGPSPIGGGMVQRAPTPVSNVQPTSGGGITPETTDMLVAAMKKRAEKQEAQKLAQKQANLNSGLTESGGYMGDANLSPDVMVG